MKLLQKLTIALVFIGTLGCAGVRVVTQRSSIDCTVAALATASNRTYSEVWQIYDKNHIQLPANLSDVTKVATELALTLVRRDFVPNNTTGLAAVLPCNADVSHMVYIKNNTVYDPANGDRQPISEFLTRKCLVAGQFFEIVKD